MQWIKNILNELTAESRRTFVALCVITAALVVFSLLVIQDLLDITNLQDVIPNSVPLILSVIGIIAAVLSYKGKNRLAAYIMIVSFIAGMMLIPIFASAPELSGVVAVIVVVVPVFLAIQALSEREFPFIAVTSLLARAAIQLLGTFKPASIVTALATRTALIAQIVSAVIIILFGLYLAWNLKNYPFRTKMILALGVLIVLPLGILTNLSKSNLETNLVQKANQSLVSSADQLAAAVDTFITSTLDSVRTEAQIPAFRAFLEQPRGITTGSAGALPRGNELERAASDTLFSLSRKDPLNILKYRLIDFNGVIQASTDETEIGAFALMDPSFITPYRGGLPYVSTITVTPDGSSYSIHFSSPIRTATRRTVGVLDITYSAAVLQQIIVRNSHILGKDVAAMLLDEDRIILAHSTTPSLLFKIIDPPTPATPRLLVSRNRLPDIPPDQLVVSMEGLAEGLENMNTVPYFTGDFRFEGEGARTWEQAGAARVRSLNAYVVTFVPQSTLLAPVQDQTRNLILFSILINLASILVALGVTQVLVTPIKSLTYTSELISQGELSATADIQTRDEVGALARGFNTMTAQLRELIASLEERVAERTRRLERRAVLMQAAADIGSTAARIRDVNLLLQQVTKLISQRFGFYHVGIFLLDERGEYAVLRASNSEGGQRMLRRGHKLKVGEVGIVGYVTHTGQPRIALDVGQDAVFFDNPDLPLTRSELTLPLIAGAKILGALDVQSSQEAAFAEEDIVILRVLADQLAIAIENARLFAENQAALEASRRAYGELSLEGWRSLLRQRRAEVGYASFSEDQVVPAPEEIQPESLQALRSGEAVLEQDGFTLHLPVKVRGQSIGVIRLSKPQDGFQWTADEIALANSLSEQLGTALESARLYNDISQRAQREYIISEITSKISASIQLETILRTSVEELGQALQDSEVIIQLGKPSSKGGRNE